MTPGAAGHVRCSVARPAHMSAEPLERRRIAEAVQIPVGARLLAGDLAVPAAVRGLVIFAHGSGSDRTSPGIVRLPTSSTEPTSRRCSSIF